MASKKIEIMDTTLRDGEQMANMAYSHSEKLNLARILLQQVKVDRIELTSAKVSPIEQEGVRKIIEHLGPSRKFEILGFVDNHQSLKWIHDSGVEVINLLTKGSLKHLTKQLKKKPEEHVADILKELEEAQRLSMDVNVYLEDWSNGMLDSKDYVFYLIESLAGKVKRIMLPDTLGALNPKLTAQFVGETRKRFPELWFDFHPHNDYGLGTANCLAAVEAGADGLHVTINGMGERAGNAPLEEVVVAIKDFMGQEYETGIEETALYQISRNVEIYSTIRMAPNKPIVGSNVFTQTAGVHADGDKKGGLYVSRLLPERFGRVRKYALGKLSGKANLDQNLEQMGIILSEEEKKRVLSRIIELGDRKQMITSEDLPYIIDDVLDSKEIVKIFAIKSCVVTTSLELKPIATILVEYNGERIQEIGSGDGGYDAFINALLKISEKMGFQIPPLVDYQVQIPPGGKTDALVQTNITWQWEGREIKTKGVHSDQLLAAVEATEKVVNKILGWKK